MLGRGVLLAGGEAAVLALAERTGAAVVSTLLGIGAMPESHPLMFGMGITMIGPTIMKHSAPGCDACGSIRCIRTSCGP